METTTVVLVPVWGAGHLMPTLEAGKRLLASSGGRALSVTVLVLRPPAPRASWSGEGQGLVWPASAPQKDILTHGAVGGFVRIVKHCGWNSILESLWFGVPMAPWPLYAEQHLNAFALVAAMGVAVAMEVNRRRDNFVEAAELERAVKELMGAGEEGRKAREKAAEMQAACRKAIEDRGSSTATLSKLKNDMCRQSTLDSD